MENVTRYDLVTHQRPVSRKGAGALKLKPLPEHNSWRGPRELDIYSQAGYWLLWTWLQYLGQLTCPCFKFLFCWRRNNSVPIHVASWTQHEVYKCELCVSLAYRKRLNTRLVLFLFSTFARILINIFIWALASRFDPAHKDVVSACCLSFNAVEFTSGQQVNAFLSKSNKAESKRIALRTKDLMRERQRESSGDWEWLPFTDPPM